MYDWSIKILVDNFTTVHVERYANRFFLDLEYPSLVSKCDVEAFINTIVCEFDSTVFEKILMLLSHGCYFSYTSPWR